VEKHRVEVRRLDRALSVSEQLVNISPDLFESLAAAETDSSHVEYLKKRYPNEPYRLRAAILTADLKDASEGDMVGRLLGKSNPPLRLRSMSDLMEPLDLIDRTLRQENLQAIADAGLNKVRYQAQVFGLHVARLDIRQYSEFNTAVISELLHKLGRAEGFGDMDGPARAEILSQQLQEPIPDLSQLEDLSDEAQETLALFRILYRAFNFYGSELLGPYIVSMTHGPEDILAPLLLAYWHKLCLREDSEQEGMSFVPLFETRQDMRDAPEVMTALFEHPAYRPHLEAAQYAANDHDRLFRQQQGCRLSGRQLGTVPDAGVAGRHLPRLRRDHDAVSRAGRHDCSRRWSGQPGYSGPTARFGRRPYSRHRTGGSD
jgi:phosphoenolpyruvate carboxylase